MSRSAEATPRPGIVRFIVFPDHAGLRLDQGTAALTGLPRRRVRALAAEGRLWLNGKAVRVVSRQLHVADVVDVVAESEALAEPAHLPPPLGLLHEDGWLVAIDKPAGVASQPPRRRAPGELTAQERLALQLAARDGRRFEPLLFHRLDRLTTGVLLFACQREAARALSRGWAEGGADKRYLTVVRGDPGETLRVVAGPIARDGVTPGRFQVSLRGRAARTEVRRLAAAGGLALVEVHPLTGRTHQVRVHLAHAGFPVAGDSLYGGGSGVPRPFLHAWRLALPHPKDGARLRLEAPVPSDMAAFLAAHGLDWSGGKG
ncbi:MAG: RluA family pseudouridine synthase [Acidobacteriia bacterium]|nr:RluA family pseudouridine synthase [Terriglobia bacterium]